MSEQIRFCHNCGNRINIGDRFCIKCGQALLPVTQPTPGQPSPAVPRVSSTLRPGQRFSPVQGAVKKLRSVQIAEQTSVPYNPSRTGFVFPQPKFRKPNPAEADKDHSPSPSPCNTSDSSTETAPAQAQTFIASAANNAQPYPTAFGKTGPLPGDAVKLLASSETGECMSFVITPQPAIPTFTSPNSEPAQLPNEHIVMQILFGALIGFVTTFVLSLFLV